MTASDLACKDFVELVTSYFEHTLPTHEQIRFEEHLADCPYCDEYLVQMRETIRLVGRLSEDTLPEDAKRDMLLLFRDWTRETEAAIEPE